MSALQSINSIKPLHMELVNCIRRNLYESEISTNPNYKVKFTWVPSHVGIKGNELADKQAQKAARVGVSTRECLTIGQFKTLIKCEQIEFRNTKRNKERSASYSIKHYDLFVDNEHKYGQNKLHTGPCDRIAARIRLGYRKIWQLKYETSGVLQEEFSNCDLCNEAQGNTLEHYICFCVKLKHFRPPGLGFVELCNYFCKPESLYPILLLYPNFRF